MDKLELLVEHLTAWSKLRAMGGMGQNQITDCDIVYENGYHMKERFILPDEATKLKSRQCYHNAWTMRNRRKKQNLRYCEGYVYLEKCPIPVHHGWCLNKAGQVVDPSVDQLEEAIYYGVEFKSDFAERVWVELKRNKLIGIMPNMFMLRSISMQDYLEGFVK